MGNRTIDTRVQIGNVTFHSPVMVASGTFGYGFEYQDVVDVSQLGAVITKSITREPRAGNRPPRIVETAAGMLNSIGLANIGLQRFVEEMLPRYENYPTRIIVNIAGSTPEEYLTVLEALAPYPQIAAFEMNYSCPNVKEGGICFGVDANLSFNLTQALRNITSKPLIIKLTPNITSPVEVALAVQEAGADAVSMINTLVGMAVDIRTWKPRLGNITGGLSGPAIKPIALAQIWQVYQEVSIPIIGMGGISSVHDAIEFFLVGASAVQIGTANFVHPPTAMEITSGLTRYMQEKGLASLQDIIGKLKVEA